MKDATENETPISAEVQADIDRQLATARSALAKAEADVLARKAQLADVRAKTSGLSIERQAEAMDEAHASLASAADGCRLAMTMAGEATRDALFLEQKVTLAERARDKVRTAYDELSKRFASPEMREQLKELENLRQRSVGDAIADAAGEQRVVDLALQLAEALHTERKRCDALEQHRHEARELRAEIFGVPSAPPSYHEDLMTTRARRIRTAIDSALRKQRLVLPQVLRELFTF